MKIVMAGASGALGSSLLKRLKAQGHWVRVIARSAQAEVSLRALGADDVRVVAMQDVTALSAAMDQCELLWSSIGASTSFSFAGWRGYNGVDIPVNCALIDAAKRAGVARFAYTSLAHADAAGVRDTIYAKAHEQVVRYGRESGLRCNVLRPTGFFSAFAPIAQMAAKGYPLAVFADGSARSNPIHPEDLADFAMQLIQEDREEFEVGGPEVLTRREMVELAFASAGKKARILQIHPGIGRAQAFMVGLLHPRMGQLMRFLIEVSVHEAIAQVRGSRRMSDYFAELNNAK